MIISESKHSLLKIFSKNDKSKNILQVKQGGDGKGQAGEEEKNHKKGVKYDKYDKYDKQGSTNCWHVGTACRESGGRERKWEEMDRERMSHTI